MDTRDEMTVHEAIGYLYSIGRTDRPVHQNTFRRWYLDGLLKPCATRPYRFRRSDLDAFMPPTPRARPGQPPKLLMRSGVPDAEALEERLRRRCS